MKRDSQSTNHIMMMEPVAFCANEQTAPTNQYQHENPDNVASVQEDAVKEFRALRDVLVDAGVIVTTVLGQEGSPDDVFCNNWVSTYEDRKMALYPMLADNRRIERRPELLDFLSGRYDTALDLSREELSGRYLESTGAHVLDRVNRVAYCGLSARSDEALAREWAKMFDYELVTFETRNHAGKPVYHTDVMIYIGSGYAGVCLDAIVEEDRKRVRRKMEETHALIEISADQLRAFCGNALQLYTVRGERILAMSGSAYHAYTETQKQTLLGYVDRIVYSDISVIETYGGGSVRCMLLEMF